MTFIFNGIITKIIIGNTSGKKYACNKTYLNTSQVIATGVFFMIPPLSMLVKLIPNILTNENTTGNIPPKQWYVKV